MTSFVLKIIACIAMFCDHIGYAIPQIEDTPINYIGRIAFPIFAFLISQGYIYTKNLKKYFGRLFLFAIISQIPFYYFRLLVDVSKPHMLNIMFTLILGLTSITIYDKISKIRKIEEDGKGKVILFKIIGFIIACIPVIIGKYIQVDYGAYGVFLIFLFYLLNNKINLLTIIYVLYQILYFEVKTNKLLFTDSKYIIYLIVSIIPIILIRFYNGKEGKKLKYFFYIFYPLQLLITDIIAYVIL